LIQTAAASSPKAAAGEFAEGRRDQTMTVSNLGAEFIVPTTQVLHERIAPNDHPRRPVGLQPAHRPQPRL
jgi:hypothetical protein